MPSYRRDRPSGGRPSGPSGPSSRLRREEASEEEERGFRRLSFLRREAGPSEFASRPVGPAERRELWEVLVPKSEQEDPYFDYDKVFEVLRPGRGGGSSAVPPPPPPREGPPRGEPARRNTLVDSRIAEAMGTLDVHRIWDAVLTLKADPRFRQGSPVAIVRIARQADLPQIFELTPSDVNAFLEGWAYEVNAIKPRDLRGRFLFQPGKDGFVWLAYVE